MARNSAGDPWRGLWGCTTLHRAVRCARSRRCLFATRGELASCTSKRCYILRDPRSVSRELFAQLPPIATRRLMPPAAAHFMSAESGIRRRTIEVCRFAASLVALAVLQILFSAVCEGAAEPSCAKPALREQDEVWLVSSRGLGGCNCAATRRPVEILALRSRNPGSRPIWRSCARPTVRTPSQWFSYTATASIIARRLPRGGARIER